MASYAYTLLGENIPAAPLIQVTLSTPGIEPAIALECSAFLDTGADCTLVPFDLLVRVQAQVAGASEQILGTAQQTTSVVPYFVGMSFDCYFHPVIRVRGCPNEVLGGIILIGRDLLNQYCIEFNGPEKICTIQSNLVQ